MASLFDVSLRPPEPADQEIPEALFGARKVSCWVHRSEKVVLRDLPVEGADQACKTCRANHGVDCEFLHRSPIKMLLTSSVYYILRAVSALTFISLTDSEILSCRNNLPVSDLRI